MQEILKVSIIQSLLIWENVDANIEHFQQIIHKNFDELAQSDIVILPEMFTTSFTMNTKLAKESREKGFKFLRKNSELLNTAFCGSMMWQEKDKVYNRLYFINSKNEIEVSYNKKHLFTLAGENKHYNAGDSKILIDYKGWKILPLICYDIRFPVWCRRTIDHNYDLAIVVASWPEKRSFAWRNLLPARAIENQAYIAAVNRVGEDGNGILHSGDSVVLDYRGKPLVQISPFQNGVATCEISFSKLILHRKAFRFFDDRDDFLYK